MSILNVKTCITVPFIILAGWFFNQCVIPVFAPQLVATPVAGLLSVVVSLCLWLILYLLFARHDSGVRAGAGVTK